MAANDAVKIMFTPMCPHLRRFLTDRGLYIQFLVNLITDSKSIKDYTERRTKLGITNPNVIDTAFDWYRSFEGEAFWSSVHRKWEIEYKFLVSGGVIKPYIPTEDDEDSRSNI